MADQMHCSAKKLFLPTVMREQARNIMRSTLSAPVARGAGPKRGGPNTGKGMMAIYLCPNFMGGRGRHRQCFFESFATENGIFQLADSLFDVICDGDFNDLQFFFPLILYPKFFYIFHGIPLLMAHLPFFSAIGVPHSYFGRISLEIMENGGKWREITSCLSIFFKFSESAVSMMQFAVTAMQSERHTPFHRM